MKQLIKITTSSPEETKNIGYRLGKLLKGGEIICMNGDLGAGKTTLTQSIAEGLEVNDYVTSPTFTIVNEYEGRHKLYHFDVYRIGEIDEMYDLGYEEYFYSDGVTIIEWSSMIEEILPKERLNIEIRKGYSSDNRELIINSFGERYDEIIKELKS
ncbi:tRNA (adenosine(37)-N6)-threonylcarbamoyltransferase complex ATPase subunit type 1 TsaE [Gottschalkia purinilytica]|uniref:tRNA (adenosine(37)-N6)-threonylcarbamoyltransferase complex ATPase subunit type 1 TsaE n=1 Tax=Gottschalkia purinilytica TaxID=1503 RepID=UPI00067C7B2B|nr:tRNA (adenosine(37)-N6)-threonylcarbamoyltransferase complex ATPase subunit type 1 TsaE [Gottschalkia purinilytica]